MLTTYFLSQGFSMWYCIVDRRSAISGRGISSRKFTEELSPVPRGLRMLLLPLHLNPFLGHEAAQKWFVLTEY